MDDSLEYSVFPREAQEVEDVKDPSLVGNAITGFFVGVGYAVAIGLAVSAVMLIVGIALEGVERGLSELYFSPTEGIVGKKVLYAAVILASAVGFCVPYYQEWKEVNEKRKRVKREEYFKAQNEAVHLANMATDNLIAFEESAKELPLLISKARQSIGRARHEFSQRAFAPFWDAVEHTVRCLAKYDENIKTMEESSCSYYSLLSGRLHNFPSLRVRRTPLLPDTTEEIRSIKSLVYKAQKDFEFSTIWEQRATRRVLIAGFETLGEAVENLGFVFEQSMASLSETFESGVARMVEEDILNRKASN